jgi:hypothetical protein
LRKLKSSTNPEYNKTISPSEGMIMKSEIDNLPEAELDQVFHKQNSYETNKKFTELVQKDLDTYKFIKNKELAVQMDAIKLARVNPNMILDVKKPKDLTSKCFIN